MTTTAKLALELLAAAAANQTLANTTFAQLNQLVQAGAVDKDLATPPGSPANEALYIVAGSPTGAWSGKAGQLAYWLTSTNAWQFIVPREGFLVHVNDEDDYYKYDGAAWAVFSPGGGLTNPMTTLGDIIRGGASGVPQRLAVGADGQVLTVVSGEPEWADPAGGGFTGGTLTSALNEAPAVTIASASTVNIGAAAANTINITGTTTITAFDTIANGAVRLLEFAGALTLTHNATSLILPTGADIVTTAGDVAEFRSLGSGNWRCVGYMRADGTPLAGGGGGGGLTNFAESKNTSAPNATVPAVSLSVSITEASGDAVYAAKGTGASLAQIPDNTTTGGDKRGTYATDWQKARAASDQVASGTYSVLGGGQNNKANGPHTTVGGGRGNFAGSNAYATVGGGDANTAGGTYAFVGGGQSNSSSASWSTVAGGQANTSSGQHSFTAGFTNTASATYSIALGDTNTASGQASTAIGRGNLASGADSIALGAKSSTRGVGSAMALAGGGFFAAAAGSGQAQKLVIIGQTTNATPKILTVDEAAAATANQLTLPNTSAYSFKGRIVARENATGDCSAWEFSGLIRRGANAAATALVAAVSPTVLAADAGAAAWVVSVTADTTNGALQVTVTGEASHVIKWVADIETVEVVG